jgi:hypothetical protein
MKIIDTARKYIGQKEMPNNTFDEYTSLGRLVKSAGQTDGEAWCSYFAEGVACEAYPNAAMELQKLFSASAVATFSNFKKSNKHISALPVLGAVVVWQKYKNDAPTWQGHVGIVSKVEQDGSFWSIEGNSNRAGSREADSVVELHRRIVKNSNGLNVLGFIILGYEPTV